MSDLATIKIPVDSSDMVQAVRDSKNLERSIKLLVAALDSGAIGSNQFSKGLLQLKTEYKGLFTDTQQATARIRGFASALMEASKASDQASDLSAWFSAQRRRIQMMQESERIAERQAAAEAKLTKEIIKQREAQERANAANAQNFQAGIGSNLGLGAVGISASASASVFEQEIESLRQKYDSVYAASQIYERSLNELNRAHALGAISTKQHEAALESLNAEYQAFANGTATYNNRFQQGVNHTTEGINNAGVLMQQAGYQIGDFIVQVQSGTNAFVAFGQQATQLVGFLPLLAAEAGVAKVAFMGLNISMAAITLGLSIIIPLVTAFGALWMRTSEANDAAAQSIQTLDDKLKSLDATLKDWIETKKAASLGLTVDEFVATQGIDQAKADLEEARKNLEALSAPVVMGDGGGALASFFVQSMLSGEVEDAQLKVNEALKRYTDLQEMMNERYEESKANLLSTTALERQRVRFGEQSVQVKSLEANLDRQSYYADLKASGLNAQMISQLMEIYNQREREVSAINNAREAASGLLGKVRETLTATTQLASVNLSATFNSASAAAEGLLSRVSAAITKLQALKYIRDNSVGGTSYLANQYALYGAGKQASKQTVVEAGALYTPFVPPEIPSGGGGGGRAKQLKEEIALTKELTQAEKDRQTILSSVNSTLEDGFMSMVDGTTSVKDAFKNMATEIIKELYRVLVVQRMVNSLMGALGFGSVPTPTATSFGTPNFFGGGRASGGSVMPGRSYLVGEHGPELIVPRHSGTVVNANRTANALGSKESVVVNNNITVTGSDAAMVRTEVAKMIPQITNATKAAIIDAKKRGGQMAATFG